jgi:hypothetical protein
MALRMFIITGFRLTRRKESKAHALRITAVALRFRVHVGTHANPRTSPELLCFGVTAETDVVSIGTIPVDKTA